VSVRLLIHADDFGVSEAVSRGILRAHRDGVVTSTSVLAVGPAFARTVPWLLAEPRLGVGVHLAAVGEHAPLLVAAQTADRLLHRRERTFPRTWIRFLLALAGGRVRAAALCAEFDAQIRRVLAAGIRPTHLDSHQHLHALPVVRAVVLDLARRHGVRAIRVPQGSLRRPAGLALSLLGASLRRDAARGGVRAPDRFLGFADSGRMGRPQWARALRQIAALAPGTSCEVGVHPGATPSPTEPTPDWGFRWEQELEVLTSSWLRARLDALGVRLCHFGDLAP
jgi:predicted glycoside hydrolase/deacetylase ChbG (UPF0249 family)